MCSQRDAASLACTSRRFRALSLIAALTARILPLPKQDYDELKASSEQRLSSCANSFPGTPCSEVALRGCCCSCPSKGPSLIHSVAETCGSAGAATLDFSGHSVEDSFLLAALPAFSKLRAAVAEHKSQAVSPLCPGAVRPVWCVPPRGPKTCSHAVMAGITLQATVSHIATHSFIGQSRAWSAASRLLATFGHFVICVSTSSHLFSPTLLSYVCTCAAQAATTTAPAWRASACSGASSSVTWPPPPCCLRVQQMAARWARCACPT